jgi:putative serine protease PepD
MYRVPAVLVPVRRRLFAAALGATLFALAATASAVMDLPELAEITKPSVVHLEVQDGSGNVVGSGTGFVVGKHRVVTNEHVIAGASAVRAKLTDGRVVDVSGVVASDKNRDIAVVELVGDDLPAALPLGASEGLRQGDEVVVIGSPRGLAGTLSTGIISALRGEGLDTELADGHNTGSWAIQITAAISPGSSGSPIMTRDGKVVAVAVGIVVGGGNIGFGVPIEEVTAMLDRVGPAAKPKPFSGSEGSSVVRNLVISGIFFALVMLGFFVPGWLKRRRESA